MGAILVILLGHANCAKPNESRAPWSLKAEGICSGAIMSYISCRQGLTKEGSYEEYDISGRHIRALCIVQSPMSQKPFGHYRQRVYVLGQ